MMRNLTFLIALALLPLSSPPAARAQSAPEVDYSRTTGAFWNLGAFRPRYVPEADLADSARADQLIRDGKLYLTLADAMALALENNLDIAVARYGRLEAATDLLRARAGGNLRGVQTQISTLSTGQSAGGGGGGGGLVGGPRGQATGISQGASQGSNGVGNAASFFGTQVTNLDPTFSTGMTLFQTSNPQISSFVIGTNTLINKGGAYNFNFSQGFTTGTTVGLGFTSFQQENNNIRNSFNPTLTAEMSLTVTQRLTQGFGRAVNNRNIRIAKNNQEIEDLNFREQVISTVGQIERLYWDLVTFRELADARRSDLELSNQLVADTEKQVKLGMQAAIEVVRLKAEATSFRQQLAAAESSVREQQEILKNALTKHGPTSATLEGIEIVPTDHVVVPDQEPIRPIQDLIEEALRSRPALSRSRINLANSDINLRGIKNSLKPALDLTAATTNNSLAGTINRDVSTLPDAQRPDKYFAGGLGTALGQIFRRNFPDYVVQLRLSVPLKNRQAQADMTSWSLQRRRDDILLRQQENSIKLEVSRGLASLQQARETYLASREARELREQMLEAERKRLALGSSTIFQIVQAQRDLSGARTTEVNALNSYKAARLDMDRITGKTLQRNSVSIDEAYAGEVAKAPDPIPPALLQR